MGEDSETVYRVASSLSGAQVIHTDPQCPIVQAHNVEKKRRDQFPSTPICKHCKGETEHKGGMGGTLAAKLANADSLDELREGSA